MKPSQKWIEALQWIAEREPIGWFPIDGPSGVIRKRLRTYGLIEEAGREPGALPVTKFRVSAAGRALMKEHGI